MSQEYKTHIYRAPWMNYGSMDQEMRKMLDDGWAVYFMNVFYCPEDTSTRAVVTYCRQKYFHATNTLLNATQSKPAA